MAKTIRDVAKRANVSIATVSRVLNNTAQVNSDKRQRVEEAIKSLGFIPNQVARSLVQKKTKGVGVLLPSLGGEFFSEFLQGIDDASRNEGHYVLISASHGNIEELETALKGMHQRVDGLIIMSPEYDGMSIKHLIADDSPVVLINSAPSEARFDTMTVDNFDGAFRATSYLLELGHRTIAMLKGRALTHDGLQRLAGYQKALEVHGIAPQADLEIAGNFTPQGGYQAAATLLNLKPRPTAVFCANDQSAIGLMAGLQNEGVKIPEDISIIGFDDIPSARLTAPALTSVNINVRQLGVKAVERLMDMGSNKTPQHCVLPVELVVRQTTTSLVPQD